MFIQSALLVGPPLSLQLPHILPEEGGREGRRGVNEVVNSLLPSPPPRPCEKLLSFSLLLSRDICCSFKPGHGREEGGVGAVGKKEEEEEEEKREHGGRDCQTFQHVGWRGRGGAKESTSKTTV